MKEDWSRTLQYLFSYVMKYKIAFIVSVLAVIIANVSSNILIPFFFKQIIDLVSQNSNLVDKTVLVPELMSIFLILFILYIILNVGWRTVEYVVQYFESNAMRDIENNCFQKLENHSFNFFTNNFGGALVTKVNRITRAYERLVDIFVFEIISVLVKIIFSIIILFFFIPLVSYILIVWTIVYVIVSFFVFRWKYKFDKEASAYDSKVTAALADAITNIFNVKIFAKKEYEADRFFEVSDLRKRKRLKAWNFGAHINVFQAIIMLVLELGVIYIGIMAWSEGTITVGTLVLIQTYAFIITMSLWNIGRTMRGIYESLADAKEMVDIIDLEEDIQDVPHPEKIKIDKGEITIKEMTFRYNKKTKLFEDFNLHINPGQTIGLVGESGSGKSSLTKLLLRFVDVNKGEILIDGQNIAHLKQEDLRAHISYVPQESILFHRTLAENIAYSNPKATKKEIIAAAKKANVHDFIMSLPDAYDTYVGERGIKLSGGERQRVAIARAILKKAPIIIFDEATSSLDSKSEKLIQQAMDNLMKGKTTIVIAHRLSTIQKMDRIIVMEDGKIIEDGSHERLIKKKGKYHELWNHQVNGFIE